MIVDLTGLAASSATLIFAVMSKLALGIIDSHLRHGALRNMLDAAIQGALGKMQQASQADILQARCLHPNIANPLMAVGARFVISHASDAVDHFSLTPDQIAEKIQAQLGLAHIATNLAIAGNDTPATPAPLDKFPVGSMTTAELNTMEANINGGKLPASNTL